MRHCAKLTARTLWVAALLLVLLASSAPAVAQPAPPASNARPGAVLAVHQEMRGTITDIDTDGTVPIESTTLLDATLDISLGSPFALQRSTRYLNDDGSTTVGEEIQTGGVRYARFGDNPWVTLPPGTITRSPWTDFVPGGPDDGPALALLREGGVTVTTLPDDVVRGIPVHHLRISAAGALSGSFLGRNRPPSVALVMNQRAEDNDELPENDRDTARVTIDLWSGIEDHFPYRMTLVGSDIDIRLAVVYDQYPLAEPIVITAPEGATPAFSLESR